MPNSIITKQQFEKIQRFFYNNFGINLADHKKSMVESRIQKRVRILKFADSRTYLEYAFSEAGRVKELSNLIDVITTNTTSFFRESGHFHFLKSRIFPEWADKTTRPIRIWSAGCSSGEEPYSIAITCEEFRRTNPSFSFQILATDLSSKVLAEAKAATYPSKKVDGIHPDILKRYFLRHKDPEKELVRLVPAIRNLIEFRRVNLLNREDLPKTKFDIIFCRNVIIYFDRETQLRLLSSYTNMFDGEGYLFLGHSESLSRAELPFDLVAPTTYRRRIG